MDAADESIAPTPPAERARRGGARGFTLAEVLVAVVVLSVGVLGVAGLTLAVARESRRSVRETARTQAARRALDSICRAGFAAAADGSSAVALDGREWTVTWEVTREAAGLKRVDLRVSAGPRGGRGRPFAAARLHRRPGPGSGGTP